MPLINWQLKRIKGSHYIYSKQGQLNIITVPVHANKTLNGNNGTYAKYMADAIFKVPTPQLLEKIVTALDDLYIVVDNLPDRQDARGDLYEYMLFKLSTATKLPLPHTKMLQREDLLMLHCSLLTLSSVGHPGLRP